MSKTKSKFREKILKSVNVPVERISFRKDKWGELATVYFGKSHRSASIGDDDYTDKELFEGFLISVKIGSRSFVAEAKKVYGDKWKSYVKQRPKITTNNRVCAINI